MSTKNEPTAPSAVQSGFDWHEFARGTCTRVDWTTIAQRALGSATLALLVGGAVNVIGRAIEADMRAKRVAAAARAAAEADIIDAEYEAMPEIEPAPASASSDAADPKAQAAQPIDRDAAAAATILGVAVDASADEIRAALRRALSESRLHPDHGGDGEEAKRLIAAKNLLIRARAVRS
jgi:hypothetical protein